MREGRYRYFVRRNREAIVAYILFGFIFALYAFNQNDIFTRFGLASICNQVMVLSAAAMAQTLVILTGGFDMSCGALISLCNVIAASVMIPISEAAGSDMFGVILTVFIVIAVGILGGLLNGLLVVYGRLQAIIVTLATSSIFTGFALYIMDSPGGKINRAYCKFVTGRIWGCIPVSLMIMLLILAAFWIPFKRSRLCRAIYACGGNEYSAYVSGIKVKRSKIMAYMLAGVFCGVAAMLLAASTSCGDPTGGNGMTMKSVSAVVLGGTSLSGGRGGYGGSFAGAFILAMVLGLLIFWGVSSFWQAGIQGCILIAAVAMGHSIQRGK